MKIKQFLVLFSLFISLMSCGTPEYIIVNKKIIDPEGEPMLIGQVTREALTQSEFNDWYSEEYNSYIPDPKVVRELSKKINHYTIEVFFGTWCSDAQEQLPRFMKILDEVKYSDKKLKLYALNRKMQSFYGEHSQKAIVKIPTIIVYKTIFDRKKGYREIGRIVESPTNSLELDLYKIINGVNFEDQNLKAAKKNINYR